MAKRDRIECTCCGKSKRLDRYYQSQSKLYKGFGFLTVCKDCIDDYYHEYKDKYKYDKEVMYRMCMLFDLPWGEANYSGALQHSQKTGWKIYQSYFKQINSFGDINSIGTCFAEGEPWIDEQSEAIHSEDSVPDTYSNDELDFDITPEVKLFWGKGFKDEDYFYLENFYDDFIKVYECDTPAQVLLFKNAAKTQLNADKALAEGNINLYDKLMKTLSTILGDSNIKPVQETGANATEQATFGTLIKKWENEKPIPEPLEEWERDNWIEYMKIWFLSHLAKMTNTPNPFEEEYEDAMSEFRVESPSGKMEDGD